MVTCQKGRSNKAVKKFRQQEKTFHPTKFYDWSIHGLYENGLSGMIPVRVGVVCVDAGDATVGGGVRTAESPSAGAAATTQHQGSSARKPAKVVSYTRHAIVSLKTNEK